MFYLTIALAIVFILPTILFVRDGLSSKGEKDEEEVAVEDVKIPEMAMTKSIDDEKSSEDTAETAVRAPETKAKSKLPIVKTTINLFRKPKFILLCFLMMFISCIRECFGGFSMAFIKSELKLDNALNGGITASFCVFSAIGAMVGGRLIDSIPKLHRSGLNVFYLSGVALSFLLIALATDPNGIISFPDISGKAMFCIGTIMFGEVCSLFFLYPASPGRPCILHRRNLPRRLGRDRRGLFCIWDRRERGIYWSTDSSRVD